MAKNSDTGDKIEKAESWNVYDDLSRNKWADSDEFKWNKSNTGDTNEEGTSKNTFHTLSDSESDDCDEFRLKKSDTRDKKRRGDIKKRFHNSSDSESDDCDEFRTNKSDTRDIKEEATSLQPYYNLPRNELDYFNRNLNSHIREKFFRFPFYPYKPPNDINQFSNIFLTSLPKEELLLTRSSSSSSSLTSPEGESADSSYGSANKILKCAKVSVSAVCLLLKLLNIPVKGKGLEKLLKEVSKINKLVSIMDTLRTSWQNAETKTDYVKAIVVMLLTFYQENVLVDILMIILQDMNKKDMFFAIWKVVTTLLTNYSGCGFVKRMQDCQEIASDIYKLYEDIKDIWG